MKRKKHEERMVFSVKINLNDAYVHRYHREGFNERSGTEEQKRFVPYLEPDGVYSFGSDQRYYNYKEVLSKVESIAHDFKSKCNKENAEWMKITEVKLLGIQQGSIKVTLSLLMTLFDVAGGIKNIYDCAEIVRNMLSSHFEEELASKYGGTYFKADTTVLTPTGNGNNNVFACEKVKYERDAFFYYLLISNVVLLIAIGTLVYKAVSLMYWQ